MTPAMLELAKKLGLEALVTRYGRIEIVGTVGQLKRLWAIMGADVIAEESRPHHVTRSWACYLGGAYMGAIVSGPTSDGSLFSFSFTVAP